MSKSKFTDDYGSLNGLGIFTVGVVVLIVVGFLVGAVFGSPLKKTPADKIAVSYGGGLLEGAQYQKTVLPGSGLVANGFFDKFYEYPITQRDITVSADQTEETKDYGIPDEIIARTSDGVECRVQLAATFKLNTNHIRSFHETIGLKFRAWEDSDAGWGQMLQKNFYPPLENSVQKQCRKFSSEDIAKSSEVYATFASNIATELKVTINALLGGDDFFCGPEFVVGEEACPDFQVIVKSVSLPGPVNESLQAQATSANDLITATNKAKVREEQAKGESLAQKALQDAINNPAYLENKRIDAMSLCAANQGCTLVITDGGAGGVNINAGR